MSVLDMPRISPSAVPCEPPRSPVRSAGCSPASRSGDSSRAEQEIAIRLGLTSGRLTDEIERRMNERLFSNGNFRG